MAIKVGGNKGSGGSLSVPDDLIFSSEGDRDVFFSNNPSRKRESVNITVNNQLQSWRQGAWVDISPVIKGQTGQNAPKMLTQFSATGNSDWEDTLNLATHKYWRWSVDGGVTWSPNFVRYSGGDGGAGVPDPYSMSVSNDGKLQLFKNGKLIQSQDENGAWITNSVTTGTGSFHLGDLHSNGSAGENVLWLNTQSNICWFPAWQGINKSDATVYDLTTRKHSTLLNTEPFGIVGAGSVDYNDTFTATANTAFFRIEIVPAENYTGKLSWDSRLLPEELEVAAFHFDATLTTDVRYTVVLKYPLYVRNGQIVKVGLKKANGEFLKVRPASGNLSKPYRKTYYTTFQDHLVYNQSNDALVARGLESLTGSDALDVLKLKNVGLLNKGLYRGDIPANFAGLANATKGDWWKAASAKTVEGLSFAVGDEFYCTANTGATVTNLNNFTRVENVNDVMLASTQTVVGTAGLVPTPPLGDVKVLTNRGWGEAQYKDSTTNKKYKLIIDNGIPYMEEI